MAQPKPKSPPARCPYPTTSKNSSSPNSIPLPTPSSRTRCEAPGRPESPNHTEGAPGPSHLGTGDTTAHSPRTRGCPILSASLFFALRVGYHDPTPETRFPVHYKLTLGSPHDNAPQPAPTSLLA